MAIRHSFGDSAFGILSDFWFRISGLTKHAQPSDTLLPRTVATDVAFAQITGLYIHVPFCFHKCHYCDFYSITRQTPERMDRFVDLLLREADQWIDDSVQSLSCNTIFMGGGTPTLLPLEQMQRLLAGIRDRFDLSQVDEWTVEANPATVTDEYCRMLKAAGVNRLSFGAQSFDAGELKTLERHHVPEDVFRSVELARSAGFDRLNLDLIFAIPGQDLAPGAGRLRLRSAWERRICPATH